VNQAGDEELAWSKTESAGLGPSFAQYCLNVELRREGLLACFIFNAYWEPLEFQLPHIDEEKGGGGRRGIDTFLDPPQGIVPWQSASSVSGQTYRAGPRSVVVLWSTNADQSKYASPSVNPKLPSFMAK